MKVNKNIFYLLLLAIVSSNYFGALFLNKTVVVSIRFLFLAIILLNSIKYFLKKSPTKIFFAYKIFCFSIVFSIFLAWISWEQSFLDSILATNLYLFFFIFFTIVSINPSVEEITRTILYCGYINIPIFFIQFFNPDISLFGLSGSEHVDDRFGDFIRVVLPANGYLIFTFFYYLQKIRSNFSFSKLSLLIVILLIFVLQVTRQIYFAIIVIFLISLISTFSFRNKLVSILFLISVYLTFTLNPKANKLYTGIESGLSTKNELVAEDLQNYSRILALKNIIFENSPNILSTIFGNGFPRVGESNYGKYYFKISNANLDFSDVGIFGFYAYVGIIPSLTMLYLLIFLIFLRIDSKYFYYKTYLLFLILTILTSFYIYHYFYIFINSLVFYFFHKQIIFMKYEKQKKII